ncbi:MAG: hypothetical protein A2189_00490 [Paenibacillus sp. RIFOXYA1_FULL_44_5]|nr:MAG: hypothetical protein A2189_00490 [Paenibacillus sp. RIFOXYA1_FULL_44_5]
MKCEDIQEAMGAYSVKELSPENSEWMDQHIKTCADCRSWYEEVKQLSEIWTAPLIVDETPDLAAPVMQAIAELESLNSQAKINPIKIKRHQSLYHYALAASITLVLMQFNTFEQIAVRISMLNVHLSGSVESFFQIIQNL